METSPYHELRSTMTRIRHSSVFPCSAEALFDFHRNAENLGRLSLPGQTFRMLSEAKATEMGDLQRFEIGLGPLTTQWLAEVTMFDPPRLLEDVQLSGPFRRWRHQHQVATEGDGSRLTDVVAFRLIPTFPGEFLEYLLVRPVVLAMFAWRHRKTRQLLAELAIDGPRSGVG